MTLSEEELTNKIRVLRSKTGDFSRKDVCDYETVWKKATNDFVSMNARWIYNAHHRGDVHAVSASRIPVHDSGILESCRDTTVPHRAGLQVRTHIEVQPLCSAETFPRISARSDGSSKRDNDLRMTNLSSCITRPVVPRRRNHPSGQVVPRLREFGTINHVVLGWRRGTVTARAGQIKRRVIAPLMLMTAEQREQAFDTARTSYSNAWWVGNHKSAYDRHRKVVETVASFRPGLAVHTIGNDSDWNDAIEKFKAFNGNAISKAKVYKEACATSSITRS